MWTQNNPHKVKAVDLCVLQTKEKKEKNIKK